MENPTILVTGLSNREFLERHMRPGRVGLCGGTTAVDKAICRAQRHLDAGRRPTLWSHPFFVQGGWADGHHWVIEFDLQIHRKHLRLGWRENCVAKNSDDAFYRPLAVLRMKLRRRVESRLRKIKQATASVK